jgi:hypothetical protein
MLIHKYVFAPTYRSTGTIKHYGNCAQQRAINLGASIRHGDKSVVLHSCVVSRFPYVDDAKGAVFQQKIHQIGMMVPHRRNSRVTSRVPFLSLETLSL